MVQIGRLSAANDAYSQAIKIKSDYAEAYSLRGICLQLMAMYESAEQNYQSAIRLKPDYCEAYLNYGALFFEKNNIIQSIELYQKAVAINPVYSKAYSNLAISYMHLMMFDEALDACETAIRQNTHDAESQWNKVLIKLLLGDLDYGYSNFFWRKIKADNKFGYRSSDKGLLEHFPDDLRNKKLLVYPEQGLGDYIQMLRYVEQLSSRGCQVILECPDELYGLIQSNINARLIRCGESIPEYDFQCPIMDLMAYFHRYKSNITYPYIVADAEKVEYWKSRLGVTAKKRLGIAWSSISSFKYDGRRSLHLSEFIECLPMDEYELICLQKVIKTEDLNLFSELGSIKFFGEELHDFSDTAALASCVDLVVSTCTSIPHLTGAMNIPTWVLLQHLPDWRWMLKRADTSWYPSMVLFRQTQAFSWTEILKTVKQSLLSFAEIESENKLGLNVRI